jgi:hypothetical protein
MGERHGKNRQEPFASSRLFAHQLGGQCRHGHRWPKIASSTLVKKGVPP